MKKSYSFDELSDRKCVTPTCEKHIKQRLVETKNAVRCYTCYAKKEAGRGHTINTKARQKRVDGGLPVKSF